MGYALIEYANPNQMAVGYDRPPEHGDGSAGQVTVTGGAGGGTGGTGGGTTSVSTPNGTRPATSSDTGAPSPTVKIAPSVSGTGGGTGGGSRTITMSPNGSGGYYFNAPLERSTLTYNIPYVNESDGSFLGGYSTYTTDFIPVYPNGSVGQSVDYVPYDGKLYQVDANTGKILHTFDGDQYSDLTSDSKITTSEDGNSILFTKNDGTVYKQSVNPKANGSYESASIYLRPFLCGEPTGTCVAWFFENNAPLYGEPQYAEQRYYTSFWRCIGTKTTLKRCYLDSQGNLVKDSEITLDASTTETVIDYNWIDMTDVVGEANLEPNEELSSSNDVFTPVSGYGSYYGELVRFSFSEPATSYFDVELSDIPDVTGYYTITQDSDTSYILGLYSLERPDSSAVSYLTITRPSGSGNIVKIEHTYDWMIEETTEETNNLPEDSAIVLTLPDGSILIENSDGVMKFDKDGNLGYNYQIGEDKIIDKVSVDDYVYTIIHWHKADGSIGTTILDEFGNVLNEILGKWILGGVEIDEGDSREIVEGSDSIYYLVEFDGDTGDIEFIRDPTAEKTSIYLAVPAANTDFTGIPADRITGGAVEAKVINPPAANTDFIGISAGVDIIATLTTVNGVPANTAFTGIAGAVQYTIVAPAADTAFTGIVLESGDMVSSYVPAPCADTSFNGILPASIDYFNLAVSAPPADTAYSGINTVYPLIVNIVDGVIGRMIFFDNAANTDFSGVNPSSVEYSTLILSADAANSGFEGIPAIHVGIPAQIIFAQPAESAFTGIEIPFFVMADSAVADFTGIAGTPIGVRESSSLSVSDGIAVYDTTKSSWICPVNESVAASDNSWIQRLLSASEYINAGDSLSAKWNGTTRADDSILVLDTAEVVKFFSGVISESLAVNDALSSQLYLVVSEYLTLRDGVSGLALLNTVIADAVNTADNITAQWLKSVSETLTAGDTTYLQISVFISEYANITESLKGAAKINLAIAESLKAVDSAVSRWLFNLSESLVIEDSINSATYISIAEYLNIKDVIQNTFQYSAAVSDSISSVDSAVSTWIFNIAEEIGITDAVNAVNAIYEYVNETISMTEILSVIGSWNRGVSDNLIFSDTSSIMSYILGDISDDIAVVDSVSLLSILSVLLSESLTVVDDASRVNKSYLLVSDNFEGTDTVSNQAQYKVSVQEMLSLNISIIVDGEIYECFVLNTAQFHPSVYSGFDFNSYCTFRSRAFGANSRGVYELTGDTDTGLAGDGSDRDINTGIVFHDTDFNMPQKKKLRKAYLGVSGDAAVLITESEGKKKAYRIDDRGMVDASRVVKGKTWTLSVAEFESIESIKLIPVILARGN